MNNARYICNLAVSGVRSGTPFWKRVDQMRRTSANNDSVLFTTNSTRRSVGVSWNLVYRNHMICPGMSRRALLWSMFERSPRNERRRALRLH
jgi:hypothetical protein